MKPLCRSRITQRRIWVCRCPGARCRDFRLLVICNVIAVAGTFVSSVALPFAVLGIGGSASDVGYVASAQLIPLIAFLLLGGVVADRLPRHQVIAAANALQAAVQGTSAALLLTSHAHIGSSRPAPQRPGSGRVLLPGGGGPAAPDRAR